MIALSTYLPDVPSFESERSEQNQNTPIFMAHGVQDPVIPLALAEKSKDFLSELGYQVEWRTYPMPHSVCAEEINHIAEFVNRSIT